MILPPPPPYVNIILEFFELFFFVFEEVKYSATKGIAQRTMKTLLHLATKQTNKLTLDSTTSSFAMRQTFSYFILRHILLDRSGRLSAFDASCSGGRLKKDAILSHGKGNDA
jgi:hypothetical protein